jgi:cystathionine beta-synthase
MTATAFPGADAAPSQARHRVPYDSVLDTIGWTPLIRLNRLGRGTRTPIYGKAEFFNPGGSVKDRIGLPIVEAAERSGALRPGGTIVEGTSGNTGVGLAIAAAMRGYKCIFTMPDKMSQEKVRLLKAFGAEVIVTPSAVPPDHPDNYVEAAKRIAKERPNAVLANQFYNQANPDAHYATTGPELWEQTGGRITHFVAAAGTGGTLSGVGRYLKERNPDVQIVAADPQGSILAGLWRQHKDPNEANPQGAPYKVEGIGQDKLPGTLDLALLDDYVTVNDRDAFAMSRRLTREEGLFVGGSAGLITHAALQLARRLDDPDACVVSFLCDTGERYLSKLYNDEWMRENQLLEPDRATLAHLLQSKPSDADAPALVTTAPGALVRQAIGLMKLHDVSQLPVMEGDRSVGSVTEHFLTERALESTRFLDATVGEVMDEPFPVVGAGEPVDAVTKLLTKATPALLVADAGAVRGIVTRGDLLQFLMTR